MSKQNNIAYFITFAAISAGVWMLWRKSSRGSILENLNTQYDMSTNDKLPRGYRNNNPLNIRYNPLNAWLGKVYNTDGSFEQFISMDYGYRAALYLMRKYIRQGYNTVAKIISRWAPENENNTQAYINHVCEWAGLQPDMAVGVNDRDTLTAMARAMSIVENGTKDKAGRNIQDTYGLPSMEIINAGWDKL